jgi:WD40 repeat protein
VDQFEELFTLCTEEIQRQQFIEQLLNLSQQQPVIIIMRADFWGECAPYKALKAQMTARQSLIPPMNAAELRSAMEQQAAKVGLRFEADLSNTILDEVKDEPGAMPLLQHGLRELWNRRHGRWLRTAEYREGIGGIKSAIAKTADEIYFSLSSTERKQFQNIFIRLTRLDDSVVSGEGHRDTRRRVELEELVPTGTDLSAIKKLVNHLANARLVITSVNGEVEVAHEALIRYWPRLANWLDENRTNLQLRETIRQSALKWKENQRKEDFLVHRGVRLESAKGLAQQAGFLNQLEAEYIKACANIQDRERKEKEEQQEKRLAAEQEARRQAEQHAKQSRLWSVALLICLVLAMVAMVWALSSRQKAKESEQKAKESEQKAKKSEQKAKKSEIKTLINSSNAQFQSNQTFDALLNGLTAAIKFQQAEIQDSELEPKVYSGLQNALYGVKECNTLEDDEAPITSASFSPKGGILATINIHGRLILWKQEDEGSCHFIHQSKEWNTQQLVHYKFRQRLRFNPQGNLIAVTGLEQSKQRGVKLWKLDGTELEEFSQASMRAIFLPPDGQRFISARQDRTVQIWSTDNNQNNKGFICQIESNIKYPTELSVSKDGQWLALASKQGIKLWKIDTSADCEKLRSSEKLVSPSEAGMKDDCKKLCFSQQPSPINDDIKSIDFSPNNQLLVAANENGILKLLDLSGDKLTTTSYDHRGRVNLVRFSPDKNNQRLASAGEDKTIKLWNREGTLLDILGGHKDSVTSVDFSPDGKMLASTSDDSTVKLWLLDSKLKTTLLRKPRNAVREVLFSQDGQKLAILSDDDTISLWQQKNGEWIYNNPKKDKNLKNLNNLHFLQNDQAILATSDDKLNIWSLLDDKLPTVIKAKNHRFHKNQVSINSNYQIIATASQDKVKLWHTDGKLVTELKGHQTKVTTVTFSPDGQFLASADKKGTIKLWHWDDNAWKEKTLPPSPHTKRITNLVFSPNSKMLLSTSNDGKITLWQQQVEQSTWLLRDLSPSNKSKVNSVAFSLDSQLLVTADQGGEGKLWKVADNQDETIKHTAAINKVLFFQNKQLNRQLIATASNDNTIKFWELDGTLLTTFKGHQGGVTAIDFSPTGEFFASASEDQVILWDISKLGTLKTLIKRGCLWIKDYLLTDREGPEILKEECGQVTVK